MIESFEIEIAPVHDVKGPGFWNQLVEDIVIVKLAVADMNEGWNVSLQIEESMQFDGALGFSEICPREHGHAQIDRPGIEGIDGLINLDAEIFVEIWTTSDMN